jgi:predicted dehydrogenase
VTGATLSTSITDRPVPIGPVSGHALAEVGSDREPVQNDDAASYGARYDSGATGSLAVSRVAHGHPNTLRFEVLCEHGAAAYDNSRPAEFSVVHASGNGSAPYQRVLLGSEHLYVGQAMAFDVAGIGFGHNEAFIYQARAFLDEIAGRSEVPACPPLAQGLHNLQVQEAVVSSATTDATVAVEPNAPR